jgi:phytoene dehydrogenase-like protein
MGELEGIRGAWGYPEGGMGAVSDAIAKSAELSGAEIVVESIVQEVNKLSTNRNTNHFSLKHK